MTLATTSPSGRRLVTCGLLVLAVLLAACLRLRGINSSFWLDEVLTIEQAARPAVEVPASLRDTDTHPPLFFLLVHLALYLGDSELAVRLPALLAGIAAVPLVYALAGRMAGRAVGLAAAWLLAISPFHIHYSTDARMYSQLTLLSLLCLYALWRALEQNEKRWWAAFTGAAVLNLYTHYFGFLATAGTVLFAGAVLIGDWLRQARQTVPRKLASLLACCAAIALLYAPWLPAMQVNFLEREARLEALHNHAGVALDRALVSGILNEFAGGQGTTSAILTGAAALGLLAIVLRLKWKALALYVCLVLPFVLSVATMHPRRVYSRYLSYLQPLLVMLAATAVVEVPAIVTRAVKPSLLGRRLRATASLLGLLLVSVSSLAAIGWHAGREKPDWQAIAAYVENAAQPGDIIIVDGTGRGSGADSNRPYAMLAWYLRQTEKGLVLWKEVDAAPSIRPLAHEDRGALAIVTFAVPSAWREDPRSAVSEQRFGTVSVLRLNKPRGSAVDNSIAMLEAISRCLKDGEARFDVYLALAELYQSTGRVQQAQARVARAVEIVPLTPDPRMWRSNAYYRLQLDRFLQDHGSAEVAEAR